MRISVGDYLVFSWKNDYFCLKITKRSRSGYEYQGVSKHEANFRSSQGTSIIKDTYKPTVVNERVAKKVIALLGRSISDDLPENYLEIVDIIKKAIDGSSSV